MPAAPGHAAAPEDDSRRYVQTRDASTHLLERAQRHWWSRSRHGPGTPSFLTWSSPRPARRTSNGLGRPCHGPGAGTEVRRPTAPGLLRVWGGADHRATGVVHDPAGDRAGRAPTSPEPLTGGMAADKHASNPSSPRPEGKPRGLTHPAAGTAGTPHCKGGSTTIPQMRLRGARGQPKRLGSGAPADDMLRKSRYARETRDGP